MRTRAERRHHHNRMIKKVKGYSYYWYGWRDEKEKELHQKKTAENRKPCSCHMCGNPRRDSWSRSTQLTMQERRILQYDHDEE